MDQDAIGFGPGDFVLDGDPATATLPKKMEEPPPRFSAHVYCSQTAGWIKLALGMKVDLGLRDIVLDGNPAPSPLKGYSPQFLAHVYCGQTGAVPLGRGSWIPNRHLTRCGQGQGPWPIPACQVSSGYIQPFGHTPMLQTDSTGRTE